MAAYIIRVCVAACVVYVGLKVLDWLFHMIDLSLGIA